MRQRIPVDNNTIIPELIARSVGMCMAELNKFNLTRI